MTILPTRCCRALATLLLVAACETPGTGPSGNDAGQPPINEVDASQYCETIAPFFCPFYLRCGRLDASPDTCESIFLESCEASFEAGYVGLEAEGLIELSSAGLNACRDHLEDIACAEHPRDLDGPCAGIWVGQQQAGDACGFNLESLICEPGTECVLGFDLCGECRQVAQVGGQCGSEVTCGPSAECVDGFCVARLAIGAGCGGETTCVRGAFCVDEICRGPSYVAVGAACDARNRCPFNAHCEDGTCVLDALQGESCQGVTGCASGICEGGICVPTRVVGAGCANGLECETLLCDEGVCATTSQCLQ